MVIYYNNNSFYTVASAVARPWGPIFEKKNLCLKPVQECAQPLPKFSWRLDVWSLNPLRTDRQTDTHTFIYIYIYRLQFEQ